MARLMKHNNAEGFGGLYKKQGNHNHAADTGEESKSNLN